ncbi:lytic transglycosylase domain-containing protein [Gordonia humi]|uniref:lytic transglycosylase domain-containing protein n=1 Tax=Gordonia humi TaxID=686429 RepID=UPI0016110763|nr:lytic murein transglycosylase [Gordonia humi]
MGMSFRHSPRRAHVPRRGLAVGVGTVAVGAVMLGGATAGGSSIPTAHGPAHLGPSILTADDSEMVAVDDVTQVVPGAAGQLTGFAPPTDPEDESKNAAAQFRIAANLPDGPLGIPGIVLKAYKLAATRVAAESPQCKLPWYLLAGIGRIESGHAGNGNVDSFGDSITKVRGPVLNGTLAGNETITDTDGGKLDGDKTHDRAMGPMQFIPSTWAAWGSDANGDGKADPDNIFDATYSAGRYLCAGMTDIMSASNKVAAVMRYNHSLAYANNVLGWAAAYAAGVMPTTPIPEMTTPPKDDDAKKKDDDKKKPSKTGDKKDDKSSDKSTAPKSSTPRSTPPKSTPKPTPKPQCLGPICLPPPPVLPAPAPNK